MKNLLISSAFITLTGCSMLQPVEKPVEVITIQEPAPMYHPQLPMELQLSDIDWEVMTPETMQQYLEDMEKGDAPRKAYYGLTTQEYENLSMNMAEFKRYLREILGIVEYYREYDKPQKEEEKPTND